MKKAIEKNNIPGLLRFFVYVGEVLINVSLFFLFYAHKLSPHSQSFTSLSTLFGYMSMSLIVAYSLGVLVRPIAFYFRSDRRGSILGNVTSSTVIQASSFLLMMLVMGKSDYLGNWRIAFLFVSILFCLVIWRLFCRMLIRTLRSLGKNTHLVAFVGANDTLKELCIEMKNPYIGYKIAGYFNDEASDILSGDIPYLGTVSETVNFLNTNTYVRHVYCGLPADRAEEIRAIIDACEGKCVHFFSVPEVRNYLKRQVRMELIGSVPVLGLREDPLLMLRNQILKRSFDIFISALFMIPFWLIFYPLIALGTKIFQPGPVFFKQKRNGINGVEFECLKFRSMRVDNDAEARQATKDDPRKTKFGNFLRRSSLDELPQFINVLKGDMSIVGPRPHMVAHTEEYSQLINKYMVRHWVRPGITGWAQVNGARGETKELWQMEDRIKKDIWYIENWSISLDIQIMFLTVWNAIRGDSQAY